MIQTALCSRIVCCLFVYCWFCLAAGAQNTVKADTIDLAEIKLSKKIRAYTLWHPFEKRPVSADRIHALPFIDTVPLRAAMVISPAMVESDVYLKFVVQNKHDTAVTYFFYPGTYYEKIWLYEQLPGTATVAEIPEDRRREPEGFRRIDIGPHQVKTIYVLLNFVKTTTNTLNPALASKDFLPSYIENIKDSGKDINNFTYIFCGILLMMIFYSIAVFIINRNTEFIWYSGYASCMVLLFFLKSYLFKAPGPFNYLFESWLDFVIQSIGTSIYIAFLRRFIDARKNHPILHKIFYVEQYIIVISLIIFTFCNFFIEDFNLQNYVENYTKAVWMVSTIFFIVYTVFKRSRVLYMLATGHFLLLIMGLISFYLINSGARISSHIPLIFNTALFYYELGLAIELMFFLIALAYKNRKDIIERTEERERLKLKSERQELEKQMAVLSAMQEERNRISADMHDELGSGVTAIRLMSELVKAKMKENTLPEIERISSSANDLIIKMNTIIWTMKSENDSLESLVSYIRSYASEFLENTHIDCSIMIPPKIPNKMLTGEKRRNIFLCVKESLNNIVKHSKASKVTIAFEFPNQLSITISDNGVGIDMLKLREFGNGLSNMKKRMEHIDGEYRIENNNGAETHLVIPF